MFHRLPGFSSIGLSAPPSRALDPIFLEKYLRSVRPECFFSPGYNAPLSSEVPFAFCLHDLNHLAIDEPFGDLKRLYYARIVRPAVLRAAVVFTVSEFSRREICDWAKIAPDRIVNVSNGVSQAFCPSGASYPAENYFVHIGGARPHKNLRRVMMALANSSRLREIRLVSIGDTRKEIMRLASEFKLTDRTICLQHLSDESLAAIYRGALGLVFPSLREGFGLPIVEAMACGCPVITSQHSSMPEISGSAAILVNPNEVDEIGHQMECIAGDPILRQKLSDLGRLRSSFFSWDKTASAIRVALDAYIVAR